MSSPVPPTPASAPSGEPESDLAQLPATCRELDACADDYDIRAEAIERLGQSGPEHVRDVLAMARLAAVEGKRHE